MDKNFVLIGATRSGPNTFAPNAKPCVRVTHYQISFAPEVYKELGSPELVYAYVNLKDKMLKFVEAQKKETVVDGTLRRGYRIALVKSSTGAILHYRMKLPSDVLSKKLFEQTPKGYYVSIGGGVFKYHGPNVPIK
jgi:hypothetical protein